jgi:AraC-like DNA-binding protein
MLGGSTLPCAQMIPASDPTLVMLRSFLVGVARSAGGLSPALKAELAETAIGLLRAELTGGRPALASREVLFHGMKTYVRQHLADHLLCPEQVARAHAVSLRTAQVIFADHGLGLASYIRSERLRLAHELLVRRYAVARVAGLVGFLDPDTFTRAFKREFGQLPSRVAGPH